MFGCCSITIGVLELFLVVYWSFYQLIDILLMIQLQSRCEKQLDLRFHHVAAHHLDALSKTL